MNAREAIWGFVDNLGKPRRAAQMEADVSLMGLREARKYPRVVIYRSGEPVAHGGLVQLTIYLSRMQRIYYRPFRGESYIVSFYWEDGAYAGVAFESAAEMNDLLRGVAAGLLGWPEPVRI